MLPLFFLLGCCLCEIFEFAKPNDILKLTFRLDADNINTGFFKPEPGANMTFKVEVRSTDHKKILYKVNKLEEGVETHFSFSNAAVQDVVMTITSTAIDPAKEVLPGSCWMKFESAADTFNQDIAKRTQIEPAMYALEHLLQKVKDVTISSRSVSGKIGSLGQEHRTMLNFVVLFSFITLAGYIIFNIIQLYYMKSYLNEKKYL